MVVTEREARLERIDLMYTEMSRRFNELNQGDYAGLKESVHTSFFLACTQYLNLKFEEFKINKLNRTLSAISDPNRTSMEEVRDMDALLVNTLEFVGVQANVPSVEILMHPRGHLVEDISENDKIPEDDNENNYWLLTDDGYLEFHGGGWLRDRNGFIIDPFGNRI